MPHTGMLIAAEPPPPTSQTTPQTPQRPQTLKAWPCQVESHRQAMLEESELLVLVFDKTRGNHQLRSNPQPKIPNPLTLVWLHTPNTEPEL